MRYDTLWLIQEENDLPFVFKETFLDISKSYYPFSFWIWDCIEYVQFWNSGTIHSRVAQFCTSEILCWIIFILRAVLCIMRYLAAFLPSTQCDKRNCLQPLPNVLRIGKWGESKLPLVKNQCSVVNSIFFTAYAFISETFSLGISFKVVFL